MCVPHLADPCDRTSNHPHYPFQMAPQNGLSVAHGEVKRRMKRNAVPCQSPFSRLFTASCSLLSSTRFTLATYRPRSRQMSTPPVSTRWLPIAAVAVTPSWTTAQGHRRGLAGSGGSTRQLCARGACSKPRGRPGVRSHASKDESGHNSAASSSIRSEVITYRALAWGALKK